MTVELRSLRVVPELDASKYVAGAQQKIAADKAMATSAESTRAAQTQANARISQAGDVLARLSRQYVDGYASAQKMESALNSLSRGIETGRIQMAQAQPILDGIFRKYGQLGDGAQFAAKGQHEFAAAITATNASLAAQVQAANAAAVQVTRVNAAANQNGMGGARFNTSNLAAQGFDIATTAAFMPFYTVALQQGPQVAAIFNDIRASGERIGPAVAGAFSQILSPVSLLTIGVIGLAAAAVQFFTSGSKGAEDLTDAMKGHEEQIKRVRDLWGEATDARVRYGRSSTASASFGLETSIGEMVRALNAQRGSIGADLSSAINLNRDASGLSAREFRGTSFFRVLQTDFDALYKATVAGSPQVLGLIRELEEAGKSTNNAGIRAMAEDAVKALQPFRDLAEALRDATIERDRLFNDRGPNGMLLSRGTTNLADMGNLALYEERRRQEAIRQAESEEIARLLDTGGFPVPRPNDIERLDQGPSGADYIRSQQERIELLKTEMGLIGQSAEVRNRAVAVLEVEQEIRRRGLDLHGAEAEAMRANASLEIDLIEQVAARRKEEAERRRREIQEMDEVRSTFRGFLSDLKSGIQQGQSFWEAFGNAALRVLDRILDRWLDVLTEMAFGKGGTTEKGILGNLFGGMGGSGVSPNLSFFPPAPQSSNVVKALVPANSNSPGNVTSLLGNLGAGKSPSHISGMTDELQSALSRLIEDAPGSITINSGFRSVARQKELFDAAVRKYGSVEAARRWVAPPGRSQHNFGNAADLGFADAATRRWAHENAADYGLRFPMKHEPWHIETMGARGTLNVEATNRQLALLGDKAGGAIKGLTKFDGGLTEMAGKITGQVGGGGALGGLFGTGLNNFGNFQNGRGGGLGGLLGYGPSPTPQSGGGGFGGLFGMLLGFLPKLFGFADGTENAPPGYAWVGERGPEIVRFRGGEQVVPNHRIGAANGNMPSKIELHTHVQGASGDDHVRKLSYQGAQRAIGEYHDMLVQGGFGEVQRRYSGQKE